MPKNIDVKKVVFGSFMGGDKRKQTATELTDVEKIEVGSSMEGAKRKQTATELLTSGTMKKTQYPERKKWAKAPEEKKRGEAPYVQDDPKGATSVIQPPHPHPHKLLKEGDGGFGDGAGTVFTSTNAGIFNPTHGGGKVRRKKDGVAFITDNSPVQKLSTFLEKQGYSPVGGVKGHKQSDNNIVRIDWTKKPEDDVQKPVDKAGGKSHIDSRTVTAQKDMEGRMKQYKNEDRKKRDGDYQEPPAEAASASIPNFQKAFGNPQDDELKRGAKKDKNADTEAIDLDEEKEMHPFMKYLLDGIDLDIEKCQDGT